MAVLSGLAALIRRLTEAFPVDTRVWLRSPHGRYDMCHAIISNSDQGAVSIRKTVLPGMAIPMLKIRRPNGRRIFNMEIAIRR